VNTLPWGKNIQQYAYQPGAEFRSGKIGLQNGALGLFRDVYKFFSWFMGMGKDATGHWIAEHLSYEIGFPFADELPYGCRFATAYELYTLMGKFFVKTHDGTHWPIKIGNAYYPAKSLPSPYAMEIKGIMFLKIQIN
jgi:hypothetical protein